MEDGASPRSRCQTKKATGVGHSSVGMFARGPTRARLVELTSAASPGLTSAHQLGVAAIMDLPNGTLRARGLHRHAVSAGAVTWLPRVPQGWDVAGRVFRVAEVLLQGH